jgi:hypothetical protein
MCSVSMKGAGLKVRKLPHSGENPSVWTPCAHAGARNGLQGLLETCCALGHTADTK